MTVQRLASATKQHLLARKPPYLHQVALMSLPNCIPAPSPFLLVPSSAETIRRLPTASPISICSTTMDLLLQMETLFGSAQIAAMDLSPGGSRSVQYVLIRSAAHAESKRPANCGLALAYPRLPPPPTSRATNDNVITKSHFYCRFFSNSYGTLFYWIFFL